MINVVGLFLALLCPSILHLFEHLNLHLNLKTKIQFFVTSFTLYFKMSVLQMMLFSRELTFSVSSG